MQHPYFRLDVDSLYMQAISVTTFFSICFEDSSYLSHARRGRDKRWIPCLVIFTIWTIGALFAGLGYAMSGRSDYFGLVG